MSNFQTIKNSLKKLESKQLSTEKVPGCGVIYKDEYDKMTFDDEPYQEGKARVGYLVVPRKLSMEEWDRENG